MLAALLLVYGPGTLVCLRVHPVDSKGAGLAACVVTALAPITVPAGEPAPTMHALRACLRQHNDHGMVVALK